MPLIQPPQPPIASFDHEDIAAGVTHTPFYVFAETNSSTTSYHMGKDLVHSGENTIYQVGTGAPGTTEYVIDSLPFNLPRIVDGTVVVTFCGMSRGGSETTTTTYTLRLYHYDGSTETQLGSTWTSAGLAGLAGITTTKNFAATFSVTNKKFKIGEQLRLDLDVARAGTGGDDERETGIDPQNKDGSRITPSSDGEVTTQFVVWLPFKIN